MTSMMTPIARETRPPRPRGCVVVIAVVMTLLTLVAGDPSFARTPALPGLLEQHALPMWLVDPVDGTIVDANAAAVRFYGYPELRDGRMKITAINQLSESEIRVEMERARVEKRGFYLFPHRLASGEVVTVEVHSAPVDVGGRSLLLSVLLPESRSALLQQELQRYQTRLESLVSERTTQAMRAEYERTRVLGWSLAGSLAAVFVLSLTVASLRRNIRQRRALTDELEDTLRGARLGRLRWNLTRDIIEPCARLRGWIGLRDDVARELKSATWLEWLHPNDAPRVREALRAHLKGETDAADLRFRLRRPDGDWIWLQVWGRVTSRDPQTGRALTMMGVARDVSQEVALEESKAIAATVFEDAGEAIVVTDERGAVLQVNTAMLRMTGYARDDLIGHVNLPWRPADRHGVPGWHRVRRQLLREGRWHGEAWWRRRDGTEFPVVETISAVRDEHGQISRYVAVAQDITELKVQQKALERQAYYDLLTGLPNRVLLGDRLDLAIASARRHRRRLCVAYLDLDGFKDVNDSHGHERGDWALRLIAQRLQGALRDGDTLARVGGDEFVAVLCDLDDSDRWKSVIDRLLSASAEPLEWQGASMQLTTSIGVTLYPDDGAEAEVLLRHADQALYRAKREGKNRWCVFDPQEDLAAAAHAELVADVWRALREGNEFRLYLQPRVALADGALRGAEALLRWHHPERGVLPPAAFLPAIEQNDVMIALGDWVLDEAMRQLQRWHDAGHRDWSLSVNIAVRQLRDAGFADRLAARLANHPAIHPGRLELEIVESSALDGIEAVERLLDRCRALGVTIAIDDFGTGYSSLAYLKRLPANVVKVDQSFVRNMFDDPNDLRIIEGVVALGQAFGLTVVAEGVETAEHGELLLRFGAESAQGFGIARPMPAENWTSWVSAWRAPASWLRWRTVARSPWSRTLARLEIEHRTLWARAADDPSALVAAAQCTFEQVLSDVLPVPARQWPEFVNVQRSHASFHDACERCRRLADAGDWHRHPAIETAHRDLLDSLHALFSRLAELPNGHTTAPDTLPPIFPEAAWRPLPGT